MNLENENFLIFETGKSIIKETINLKKKIVKKTYNLREMKSF